MKKIKLILLTALGGLLFLQVKAQQTYEARHYGDPGDLYLYNRLIAGFSNDSIVQSGPGVTWDLSTNSNLNTHVNEMVEPEEGINQFTFLAICALSGFSTFDCFDIWGSTDQALLLQDTLSLLQFSLVNLQRYQDKTTNQLLENFIGFTVDLGGVPTAAVMVYQNPDTVINFPVTYGETWNSHIQFGIDLTPTGQNIMYESDQTRFTEIDSWGTLITPYDTFENVVRLRSRIVRQDTVTIDSTTLPINVTQVEYMWFDTNFTLPVATANGIITANDSSILNTVEYIYEATCPAPTWSLEPTSNVFYIGPSGSVTIDFAIQQSNANVYTWDFGDGTFGESNGSVSHEYFMAGEYGMAVTGCMTNCLPLNSCTFQIFDFEIIDTVSSISTISGSDLGILLYPNPVQGSIQVYIPEELGPQQYRISDITGRQLLTGRMGKMKSVIGPLVIPDGLYTLQMWSDTKPGKPVAIMRFMVMNN